MRAVRAICRSTPSPLDATLRYSRQKPRVSLASSVTPPCTACVRVRVHVRVCVRMLCVRACVRAPHCARVVTANIFYAAFLCTFLFIGPIFNWVDEASDTKIVMIVHPRGYGFQQASNEAAYRSAGGAGGAGADAGGVGRGDPCPTVHDVVQVPGFSEALLYMFKDDNQGPPLPAEVTAAVACTAALFEQDQRCVQSHATLLTQRTSVPVARDAERRSDQHTELIGGRAEARMGCGGVG